MKIVTTPDAPQAIGPYSQAIIEGDLIFTSGQLPLTPGGEFEAEDIQSQTEQVLDNLQAILNSQNSSLGNVIKVTVFMADLSQFPAMNDVFARKFGDHRPARSTFQVAALPLGALVEIEATAKINH